MGKTMWLMIKGSFWFSLVLVMLPFFDSSASSRLANAPPVKMDDAMTAAAGAFQYMSSMCTDRPEICEKGSQTIVALGTRAREGALVAYQMIDKKLKENDQGSSAVVEPLSTQSISTGALAKKDDVQALIEQEAASQDGMATGSTHRKVPVPQMRPAN